MNLLSDAIDGMRRVRKSFIVGKHYKIIEATRGNAVKGKKALTGTAWSNELNFEYMGKRGIHHCFRSVFGGWSRTYTDYQLVDKKILEVSINGVGNNARI